MSDVLRIQVTIDLLPTGKWVVGAQLTAGKAAIGGTMFKEYSAEEKDNAFQYAHDLITEIYEKDIVR